jgi:hypothetical protein
MGLFKFLIFFLPTIGFAAPVMTPEYNELVAKITSALIRQDVVAYKLLIHPDCPIDEAKIKNVVSEAWTDRYQVRLKNVNESYDKSQIKFLVTPEMVLEFQVKIKITNPIRIKAMGGATETELIKLFPISRYKGAFKILDWPCFTSK